MKAPSIQATMQRRILVNYRIEPAAVASLLPAPFRPALVDGYNIAGICLIRLGAIRPAGLPKAVGLTSENAAHRVAVEWDTAAGPVTGVYIPRRDTSSRLSALLGGRVFPGWQHRARFRIDERDDSYRVEVSSQDSEVEIAVAAHRADGVMEGSVFGSLEEASAFFQCAPLGYAATPKDGVLDGVALAADGWAIEPLHLDEARSSFFDDRNRFAAGTAVADSAFLMTNLDTTWRAQPRFRPRTTLWLLRSEPGSRSRRDRPRRGRGDGCRECWAVVLVLDAALLMAVISGGGSLSAAAVSLPFVMAGNACVALMLCRARESIGQSWADVAP